MLSDSPQRDRLDLLIVGGLTIDRFPDGTSGPGGSVWHATHNASIAGLRVGLLTIAGPEPEAAAGIEQLRGMAASLSRTSAPHTTTFRHREEGGERRLWLEHASGPLSLSGDGTEAQRAPAFLAAPIAGEVPATVLRAFGPPARRGAILQGWLRTLDLAEVRPLSLDAVDTDTRAALSAFDLLVASRQDLIVESADPRVQLVRMRAVFGPDPTIIVSDGENGAWLDPANGPVASGQEPLHLPVPWVVRGRPTIGAGDIFAARLLADPGWTPSTTRAAVERAMRAVAEELDRRTPVAAR